MSINSVHKRTLRLVSTGLCFLFVLLHIPAQTQIIAYKELVEAAKSESIPESEIYQGVHKNT